MLLEIDGLTTGYFITAEQYGMLDNENRKQGDFFQALKGFVN